MINGPNLLFDSTNNSSGISTVIVAANIDFTAENENLFFIGNGSAFIEPLALTAPSGLLVDTGTGDLTSNLPQLSILGLDDRQVVVRTNTANITGDLSVSSGDSAGSFAIFEGSNLTLQGGLAIVANADSAEVNFNNTVAINSPAFVDLSAGSGADAFAKLTGSDINITSTSINLLGGEGTNTIAEIRSTGDTVIDTSGAITLQGGTGSDADSVIAAGGGQGAVTLQYASCTACDNQLSSDPVGNGVSDSGIFARDLSLNGSIVVGTDPTPDPTPDPGSESSDPNPVPALDSLLANFQAGYITPVVPEGDDADEDRLSVCR